MTDAAVRHAEFRIERLLEASPAAAFAAFADKSAKRRWFAEGKGSESLAFDLDFCVGGRERSSFRAPNGIVYANETVYLDIVEGRRIIFAYTMASPAARFSASLGTVEFAPAGTGARLVYTEQAAFFEGADGLAMRKEGWGALLDSLAAHLKGPAR